MDPTTGDLKISHLRLDDFGFYQCLAKNVLSEDDRRTFLVVTGNLKEGFCYYERAVFSECQKTKPK